MIYKLPPEVWIQIIMKNTPEELSNFCYQNRSFYNLCKSNSNYIYKSYLKKYRVKYDDPNNFIYVINNTTPEQYIINGRWNYKGLLQLYMKFFNKEIIHCEDKEITSFPIYPNMLQFHGNNNELTNFPIQPKMTHFYADNNRLLFLPPQPKIIVCSTFNNPIDVCEQSNLRRVVSSLRPRIYQTFGSDDEEESEDDDEESEEESEEDDEEDDEESEEDDVKKLFFLYGGWPNYDFDDDTKDNIDKDSNKYILPNEIWIQIIMKNTPYELKSFCSQNRSFYNMCKANSSYIYKSYLEKYKVEYQDPGNFIYVINNTTPEQYKINNRWDYKGLYKLYMKYFNNETIDYSTPLDISDLSVSGNMTSFPIYPNMKNFIGRNNKLTKFPVQPRMEVFSGDYNKLKSFPIQPEMKEFYGNANLLETFPIQPKMIKFYGSANKLKKFPVQPLMEIFIGDYNQLQCFPVQPKMRICSGDRNPVKICDQMSSTSCLIL